MNVNEITLNENNTYTINNVTFDTDNTFAQRDFDNLLVTNNDRDNASKRQIRRADATMTKIEGLYEIAVKRSVITSQLHDCEEKTCKRCRGTGGFDIFAHVNNGNCFTCYGSGTVMVNKDGKIVDTVKLEAKKSYAHTGGNHAKK